MLRSRVGFVARLLDGEAMTDVCEFEVSRKKPGDRRLSASFFVAAEFGRVDAARFPVKLEEADDRADADAALHCSAASGMVVPPSIVPTTRLRTSSEYSLQASFQQTA
jgi:hypothetical protein